MTLPVFVVDGAALQADTLELTGDEGRHAAVVKRIRVGELIMLTDGQGQGAECRVAVVSKAGLVAEVVARHVEPAAQPRLVVVQAIPKGDHAERAVDLLTEIGADQIVPWAASRNVVSWKGERGVKALARWRATARAAAKQSRRLRFPDISELHSTGELAGLVEGAALAVVLHESGTETLAQLEIPTEGDIVLVVGPEGGITDDELAALTAYGTRPLRLGSTVLRSSTAGVAGAAAVLSRTPRWT